MRDSMRMEMHTKFWPENLKERHHNGNWPHRNRLWMWWPHWTGSGVPSGGFYGAWWWTFTFL